MIKELVQSIRKWHEATGSGVNDYPYFPEASKRQLRKDLLQEEVNEYFLSEAADDMVGIADGLGDIIYVCVGTAIRYGIDIEQVMQEICRSNDSKIPADGVVKRREDGKIMKPDTYTKPDIGAILWPMVHKKANASE